MEINILAIESSCDDTSAAIICNGEVRVNLVASQKIHEKYGGVVPELASRAHDANIVPVVQEALQQANIQKTDLRAVAFTAGPGLLGSLLVGVSFGKALALALDIPMIAVNHMQAHILAHFIKKPVPKFPFLCLTISGGHTQLVVVKDYLTMEIIGHTLDDAVGEAFDKAAKLLGIPYPGGPLLDKNAQNGNPNAFEFSKSNIPDLNFSFSGIKTSILYFLQKKVKENPNFVAENLADICASIQKTLVDMLIEKLITASQKMGIKEIGIAGGVSANSEVRKRLIEEGNKRGWHVYIPDFEYCTDNAAMIAITAHYKYLNHQFCTERISPNPRLKF